MSVIALLYFSCFPLSTSLHSPPTQSIAVKLLSPSFILLFFSSSHRHAMWHSSLAHFPPHLFFTFVTSLSLSLWICSVRGQVALTTECCDSHSHFYSDVVCFIPCMASELWINTVKTSESWVKRLFCAHSDIQ